MKFLIESGKQLTGTVTVSGAKNAALKMIAASVIIDGVVKLSNVPRITDVEKMAQILVELGARVTWQGNNLTIDARPVNQTILPVRLSKSLRGSVVFIGPLVARFGHCTLPWPGGCAIGRRPLNWHIDIFRDLGVNTQMKDNRYVFTRVKDELPTSAKFSGRSVTATENALLYCAATPHKKIKLTNVAGEPEIDDLINLLNKSGANIKRSSSTVIASQSPAHLKSVTYNVMGDRIEAGTWLAAGVLLGDNLSVKGVDTKYLSLPIELLKKAGADITTNNGSIKVSRSNIRAFDITTEVYPGFPTDLQSPFGLLMTQSKGTSHLDEAIFNDRLRYLDELKEMGAKVEIESVHRASISGPTPLQGRNIESTDLRAGATMVLAGLIAQGKTTVAKAEIIDRGYEKIDDKLSALGADIKRVE